MILKNQYVLFLFFGESTDEYYLAIYKEGNTLFLEEEVKLTEGARLKISLFAGLENVTGLMLVTSKIIIYIMFILSFSH